MGSGSRAQGVDGFWVQGPRSDGDRLCDAGGLARRHSEDNNSPVGTTHTLSRHHGKPLSRLSTGEFGALGAWAVSAQRKTNTDIKQGSADMEVTRTSSFKVKSRAAKAWED